MTCASIPPWTRRGGTLRLSPTPKPWVRKASYQWTRKELVPYGSASEDYRSRYYEVEDA